MDTDTKRGVSRNARRRVCNEYQEVQGREPEQIESGLNQLRAADHNLDPGTQVAGRTTPPAPAWGRRPAAQRHAFLQANSMCSSLRVDVLLARVGCLQLTAAALSQFVPLRTSSINKDLG